MLQVNNVRKKILDMLKNADGKFISGEDIAATLNVSRTAIWKHIKKLKEKGYGIDGKEKCGYILQKIPDKLLPEIVQTELDTKIICENPKKFIYFDSIDSTNKFAKKIANEGAADGTVVVAEEQTGGKGRLERDFFSPKFKSILFSVILRPKFLPKDAPKFTLMAAVAIIQAMEKFNLQAKIKWPNDILFKNKKLVGILTEMSAEIEKINFVIIGIGINANISSEEFPDEIKKIATSLSTINGGKNISRVKFFRAVLEELDKLYSEIKSNGFEKIFGLWKKYNMTLGREIKIISAESNEIFFGKAIDIDNDGALVVETSNGLKTFYAGDVSIRNFR